MGKGGGGSPAPTSSTVTNSNLPEYARPYFENLMGRAEGVSNEGYVAYPGQRVAGFSQDTATGWQGARSGIDRPQQLYGQAEGIVQGLNPAIQQLQGFDPNSFQGGEFDNAAAQKYMSPYISNVLDYQKMRASQDFNEQQAGRNAAAVNAGAFGGSRQAVADMIAQRSLNDQLQGIDATGMQAAYTNAQGMFGQDRAARMQAELASEQARQAGASINAQGVNLGMQQAQGLGSLGQLRYQTAQDWAGRMQQQGAQQEAKQQQYLDTGYQDFLNQRDYDRQNVAFMSGILRGIPVSAQSETLQYQNPNQMSQLLGLGIGGLGAARAFGS